MARHPKVIISATSLGGAESFFEHRKTLEGADSIVPDNLLRFSIGLEHPDEPINDIEQALDKNLNCPIIFLWDSLKQNLDVITSAI